VLIRAQVVYTQGLVRDVLADGEMRMCDFMARLAQFGKVRQIRSLRDARPGDTGVHIDDLPARGGL
jgi:hypothetical protein